LFISQGWAQNLWPSFAIDGRVLVQNEKVEPIAAQQVVVVGAA
jgi:hypothetical protein